LSFRDKFVEYVRRNPGALYIVAFQGMLLVCAGLLISGAEDLANEVGIYAFYTLVIGVLLQLIAYMGEGRRQRKKSPKEADENLINPSA